MFSDDSFIEGKPAKVIILKIVSVCLFRETSISSYLKEINAVRYGHERFYCIYEYFLKDLLIFTTGLRTLLHLKWYCIRSDSFVITKSVKVCLIANNQ